MLEYLTGTRDSYTRNRVKIDWDQNSQTYISPKRVRTKPSDLRKGPYPNKFKMSWMLLLIG